MPPPEPPPLDSWLATFDGRLDNREDVERLPAANYSAAGCDASLALAAYRRWDTAGLSAPHRRLESRDLGCRPARHPAGQRLRGGETPVFIGPAEHLCGMVHPPATAGRFVEAREIDEEFVAAFLKFSGCPGRDTLPRALFSVPTGCAVRIDANGLQSKPFWSLPVANRIRYSSESEYEDHLRLLFREAVRCRLPPGSRCLSELSGGTRLLRRGRDGRRPDPHRRGGARTLRDAHGRA